MYSRILVPVDLDHTDKLSDALELAAETARPSNAVVVYTGVVDAVPTMSARTDGERMEEKLKAFSEAQADQRGVRAEHKVALRGDLHVNVGSDIVRTAKETGCDLIVMASHVPGIKEHFLASNAGYVASHAPMSVYVVR